MIINSVFTSNFFLESSVEEDFVTTAYWLSATVESMSLNIDQIEGFSRSWNINKCDVKILAG